MRAASLAIAIALALTPLAAAAARNPSGSPESLLRRAVEEIRETREPADYGVLLRLSRDLARFDALTSVRLLAQGLEIARATEDAEERAQLLEQLALWSSAIDESLSTDALLLVSVPEGYSITPLIQLKLLAMSMPVLAQRQHLPTQADILEGAEDFCARHVTVRKHDMGTRSSFAFAEYVSLLEPELGGKLCTRMCPDLAWKQRLSVAKDLVHYAPQRALPKLRLLVGNAPDLNAKIAVAAALYRAGAEQEAITLLEQLKPRSVGRGSEPGDLLAQIARSDPERAMEIALAMGSEMAVRDAVSTVLWETALTHPKQVPGLLRHMDNAYRRAEALRVAVGSLADMGDLASARGLWETIAIGEKKCRALAAIGEATRDRKVLAQALGLGLEKDEFGGSLQAVMASAVRALGIEEAEKLLVEAVPEIQTRWTDARMFAVLLVIAELDPAWALRAFKRAPHRPPHRNEDVASHSVSVLLPKLAAVEPAFVADYLRDHGEAEHPQTLEDLKTECVIEIARRSPSEAREFAERVHARRTQGDPQIRISHLIGQITSAPRGVQQFLDQLVPPRPTDPETLVLLAAEAMVGAPDAWFRNIERVAELADALKDSSLADAVLVAAATQAFRVGQKEEALGLVDRIQSPWRKADALDAMAREGLEPRPRERRAFLAGW